MLPAWAIVIGTLFLLGCLYLLLQPLLPLFFSLGTTSTSFVKPLPPQLLAHTQQQLSVLRRAPLQSLLLLLATLLFAGIWSLGTFITPPFFSTVFGETVGAVSSLLCAVAFIFLILSLKDLTQYLNLKTDLTTGVIRLEGYLHRFGKQVYIGRFSFSSYPPEVNSLPHRQTVFVEFTPGTKTILSLGAIG